MSNVEHAPPIADAELTELFGGLDRARGLVLAVSGGPDSTALLLLAGRWRRALSHGPALLAVTIDHGLRPEAKLEAAAVKQFAKRCGIAHRTLRWTQAKPKTGLQQAARSARYRLLGEAAARFGADRIVTAHTLDDQAETLVMRMSRGSGVSGLGGMARLAPLPEGRDPGIQLVRPLLDIAKVRLVATLEQAAIAYADDPSNRDPRFTRSRIRALMPELAHEGLDARRLALLARRLRRADAALEATAEAAWQSHASTPGDLHVVFDRRLRDLPAEIRVRLLGRAIARVGNEGTVELGKLEALHEALMATFAAKPRLRRTLAGALVTLDGEQLRIERAPTRRHRPPTRRRGHALNQGPTLLPQSSRSALE